MRPSNKDLSIENIDELPSMKLSGNEFDVEICFIPQQ